MFSLARLPRTSACVDTELEDLFENQRRPLISFEMCNIIRQIQKLPVDWVMSRSKRTGWPTDRLRPGHIEDDVDPMQFKESRPFLQKRAEASCSCSSSIGLEMFIFVAICIVTSSLDNQTG